MATKRVTATDRKAAKAASAPAKPPADDGDDLLALPGDKPPAQHIDTAGLGADQDAAPAAFTGDPVKDSNRSDGYSHRVMTDEGWAVPAPPIVNAADRAALESDIEQAKVTAAAKVAQRGSVDTIDLDAVNYTGHDIMDERERCAELALMVGMRPEAYADFVGPQGVGDAIARLIRAGYTVQNAPDND